MHWPKNILKMDNVLIDSDVLLDSFAGRIPFSESADKILTWCESGKIVGYVTPVIISNVYYILKKVGSHKKVSDKLKELLTIVDVLEMNKQLILTALNSKFKDFEDAMQHFSAVDSDRIDIILTRNIKDYRFSELPVLTPQDYIKSLKFK